MNILHSESKSPTNIPKYSYKFCRGVVKAKLAGKTHAEIAVALNYVYNKRTPTGRLFNEQSISYAIQRWKWPLNVRFQFNKPK